MKTKIFHQKHIKTKKQKIKKSCEEASNEKSSENRLQLELKCIKNDLFKNFHEKTKKQNK